MLARKICGLSPTKICLEPTTRLASDPSGIYTHETLCGYELITPHACASLLRLCRDSKSLSHGKHVHSMITSFRFDHHIFFQNLLIQMYSSCSALQDASALFLTMPFRNTFSWVFIIRAYAEHGHVNKVWESFEQMKIEGMTQLPSKFPYISILSACACNEWLCDCKKLHVLILSGAFQLDVVIGAALVNAYRRCKSPEDAEKTFWNLLDKDVFLFNSMISMHVENGKRVEALHLCHRMFIEGLAFDKVTLISMAGACASKETYIEGKQIHASFVGSSFMMDSRICNALVSMYGKAGSLKDARTLFDKMGKSDVISWNAMIACYIKNNESKQANLIFEEMQHQNMEPSEITFVTILSACANPDALVEGRRLHAYIVEVGFEAAIEIGDALITMYGMCGGLEDAHKVFIDLPQRDRRSFTSLATAYVLSGNCSEVFQLLDDMPSDRMLSKLSGVSALSACGNQLLKGTKTGNVWANEVCVKGGLDITLRTIGILPMDDLLMWNIIIAAYVSDGNIATKLFVRMHCENVILDKYMCASVLSACARLGDLKEGKHLHAWVMCNNGFEVDCTLWNAIINLYGKCDSMEDAQIMFNAMPWRDALSWTILIEGYAKNAKGEMGLQLYQQMLVEGVIPDRVTLVGVFTTCSSHSAFVQGKQMHACAEQNVTMNESFVGNSLINMYAKCGSLHTARKVFDTMPKRDVSSWNVIITGYAQSGQVNNALCLFWQMQEQVVSPDVVTLVSILSACSHGGLSYDAWNHFSSMHLNFDVKPAVEHYNSMIDALGRSGQLDLADKLVKNMPCQPNVVSWMAFLGACRYQLDLENAACAADIILELDRHNLAPYVLLANAYAACSQFECSSLIINTMKAHCCNDNKDVSNPAMVKVYGYKSGSCMHTAYK